MDRRPVTEQTEAIKEIVRAIRRMISATYLESRKMSKRFGLTGPQSRALRSLAEHGALSSAELSRHLFVTPSNLTGIIDRLEQKDLIARDKKPLDRRTTLIKLTERGIDLSDSLPDPIEEKLIVGLGALELREIKEIQSGITRVMELIETKEDAGEIPFDLHTTS